MNRGNLFGMIGPIVSNLRLVVDTRRSFGCRLYSPDFRNSFLDMFGNIASLPLGYNHPDLTKVAEDNIHLITQRQANGVFPSNNHIRILKKVMPRILPPGFKKDSTFIHLDQSGSLAVENAIKCLYTRAAKRYHPKQLAKLPVISFTGGFHGRTIGSLSMTHSNYQHKIGFPTICNIEAPFPMSDSELDAQQCLEHFRNILKVYPTAGVIIEPIQGEGGDNHAHASFFQGIRRLTIEYDVPLIFDEVQTGMWGTGTLWCHEQFDLPAPPDIVVFSKKSMIPGFFSTVDLMPDFDYQCFNTWMGDTIWGELLDKTITIVEDENLLERVNKTGKILLENLLRLQDSSLISNVRGKGTFIAFDVTKSKDGRDILVDKLQNNNVIVGKSGPTSIRLRPPLIIDEKEVFEFLEKLKLSLNS